MTSSTTKSLIYVLVFGALVATAMAKPVKKTRVTTTAAPEPEDDGLDSILNAGLISLGNGVTCDSWIDGKMKSMNSNVDELAKMIVEAEPKELALEFIVFCLMDDQPMSDRPSMLKLAISEEKEALATATTTTPSPPKPAKTRSGKTRKM